MPKDGLRLLNLPLLAMVRKNVMQFGRQLERKEQQVSIVGGMELNGTTIIIPVIFRLATFYCCCSYHA